MLIFDEEDEDLTMIGENTSATSMRVPFVDQRNASRAKYERGDEKENDWMDVEATRTRTIFFFFISPAREKQVDMATRISWHIVIC